MSFMSVLLALLLEQVRPLGQNNPVAVGVRAYVRWVAKNFNAGEARQAHLTWGLAVGAPTLATLLVELLLHFYFGWFLAMVWNVAVLYLTLGFRQFSFHFSQIRTALTAGNEDAARQLLATWQQDQAANLSQLSSSQIVQQVMALSVLAAHRHVFGVLAWYCIPAALGGGPAGAVFYRLSEWVAQDWQRGAQAPDRFSTPDTSLQKTANAAWAWVNWLPARITLVSFALVGRFEQTIAVWRSSGKAGPDNDSLILAAASQAVGLRFDPAPHHTPVADDTLAGGSSPTSQTRQEAAAPELLETPGPSHLAVIVGLLWRTVVMWMLLLALLTFAYWLG